MNHRFFLYSCFVSDQFKFQIFNLRNKNSDQIKMLCRSIFVIALICALPSTYSYSAGAPEQACDDMIPQHHVDPQLSEAPYKLLLSSKQLRADQNESVNIKIQGNEAGNTIKGFMLQARVGDEPVGIFTVKSKKHAQLLNCNNKKGVSQFLILFYLIFQKILFPIETMMINDTN